MKKTQNQEKKREPLATYICINPGCLKPFQASARKWNAMYCSPACKQKAYRINKAAGIGQGIQSIQLVSLGS
jgi:hypothetical protein